MDYKQMNFSTFGADCFPGLVGVEVLIVTANSATARMEVKKVHLAPNGYLHQAA